MTRPMVSCVIPAFNAEAYLGEAIDSVLSQTQPPDEVIVIDGPSTDGTRAVAESYGDAVRYAQQDGQGPADARNTGVRLSAGDMVSFLDADDRWLPAKLETQLAAFDADPSLMICLTHVELRWSPERSEERRALKGIARTHIVPGFATISMLARRTMMDRLGPFDASLDMADATDWLLRAREAGVRMRILSDVLVEHRMHGSNLTHTQRQRSADEFLNMVKASLDRRRRVDQS